MQLIQGRLVIRKMGQITLIRSLLKARYMYYTLKAPRKLWKLFKIIATYQYISLACFTGLLLQTFTIRPKTNISWTLLVA